MIIDIKISLHLFLLFVFMSCGKVMLARKSRAPVFSGDKRMGLGNWNDAMQSAVKTLKSEHQTSVKTNEKPLLKDSLPISSEEQVSILLDSADGGAKMIVS